MVSVEGIGVKHYRILSAAEHRIAGAIRRNVPLQFTRVLFLHSSNWLAAPAAKASVSAYLYLRWTRG